MWDWDSAGHELRRAIELNPGDASPRLHYVTSYLHPTARTREAVAEIRRAQQLDPFLSAINQVAGRALFFDRQYGEAIRQLEHAVAMFPDHWDLHHDLSIAYASNNMPEQALRVRQEALQRVGRGEEASALHAAYDEAGEPGMLRWYIQRGLPTAEKTRGTISGRDRAWSLALLYGRLGEADEAFRWMKESIQHQGGFAIYSQVHPWLESLRSHPGYDEILKPMNLAD